MGILRKHGAAAAAGLFLAACVLTAPVWGGRSAADTARTDTVAAPDTATVRAISRVEAPVPVVVGRETLFSVSVSLGAFTAADRAEAIRGRIQKVLDGPVRESDSVTAADLGTHHDVRYNETSIMIVTDADARAAGTGRQELAERYRRAIGGALAREIEASGFLAHAWKYSKAAIATVLLLVLLWARKKLVNAVQRRVSAWAEGKGQAIRFQQAEVLSAERLRDLLGFGVKTVGVALFLLIAYVYVVALLGLFPEAGGITGTLFEYITTPVVTVWRGLVDYLPNVFFIAVILAVTWVFLRFLSWLASELGRGTIVFGGFYADWAMPTFKLVRFIVLAFSLVVVFPYLPGSGSPAFQGVGVFLGLLLSLGSASAISNMVAGFVLIYMRAYGIGDRVRVADTVGDVVEKSLLVTRIRTIKNVDVTVPNGVVLGSHIVNYSALSKQGRLILHTSVTIGYDAPWRTVHELLVSAALATPGILPEPRPFVFQLALSDFYVEYEINAYTSDANAMQQTYADLHASIQDRFNEAGVEIMSPHYTSLRDGNRTSIPDPYLPKSYVPPPFRIFPAGGPPGGDGPKAGPDGVRGGGGPFRT